MSQMKVLLLADSHGRDMCEWIEQLFPAVLTRDITYPGGEISDIMLSLENRLPYFTNWNPTHIICHAGHNSIVPHPSKPMPIQFITDLVEDIKKMIAKLQGWFPNAYVCFSGLFPRTPTHRFSERRALGYNAKVFRIGRYLKRAGIRFIFAEQLWFHVRRHEPRYEMFWWDGLHLSLTGKEAVALTWMEYLYSLEIAPRGACHMPTY